MSTPAKHTPWRVKRIEYSKGMDVSFEIVGGVNHVIAQTIMREKGDGWRDEAIKADEAHCHLMVCAPAMFSAGSALIREFDNIYDVDDGQGNIPGDLMALVGKLRAAIALATPVLEREGK